MVMKILLSKFPLFFPINCETKFKFHSNISRKKKTPILFFDQTLLICSIYGGGVLQVQELQRFPFPSHRWSFHFTLRSLSDFKHQIFASERYGNGNDFDLLISDSKIDQKLANGFSLILTNSFLLICRVPRPLGLPVAIGREEKPNIQCNSPSILVKEQLQEQGFDFDDFGLDFTSISNNSIAKPGDTHCKETKIDHGFKILSVKTLGKWRKISPQSYVWHRPNVGEHYIHHCPTNGDPKFDCKRASNTSDSSSKSSGISYASISTTSSSCKSTIVPLELHCPLCKQVMEDAALTMCCFASFCEKCVRDRIVSMETCVCRRRIVVDDILPNMTLRDTINRFLNNQSGTETSAMKRKLVNAENEDEEQRKKTE